MNAHRHIGRSASDAPSRPAGAPPSEKDAAGASPIRLDARNTLLRVTDLHTHFKVRSGLFARAAHHFKAVDGVSFDVAEGETLGLVGESGCGKTTVGRTILRLIPATSGHVQFDGRDLLAASPGEMKRLRREMQIIFQDPAGSLNPRMRVGAIVGEPLRVHKVCRQADELRDRVGTLLERCGLTRAAADRYPHEFSGGQRQRIGIARALALNPRFIVCDEPTSALDVSVQSQILNLLRDLQSEFGLSYLFISHDIAVIQHMCDRIAVMKAGKIVEIDQRAKIVDEPSHSYTRTLLAAAPEADPRHRRGATRCATV